MSPELENRLFERYPHILRRGGGYDGVVSLDVADGWYNIIDCLCSSIQSHVDHLRYRLDGPAEIDIVGVHAVQVKEKWGGLRFYITGGDEYIQGAIATAENLSFRTCETCGNPGTVRRGGWIRTLCDEHAAPKSSN